MSESKKEIMIIDQEMIKSKIYHVRGQRVMLDFELGELAIISDEMVR